MIFIDFLGNELDVYSEVIFSIGNGKLKIGRIYKVVNEEYCLIKTKEVLKRPFHRTSVCKA